MVDRHGFGVGIRRGDETTGVERVDGGWCHVTRLASQRTFHLFYNSPALNSVVAMQAFLTIVGNTTCAIAAYRIAQEGARESKALETNPQIDA